jgi:hypothetical protein
VCWSADNPNPALRRLADSLRRAPQPVDHLALSASGHGVSKADLSAVQGLPV